MKTKNVVTVLSGILAALCIWVAATQQNYILIAFTTLGTTQIGITMASLGVFFLIVAVFAQIFN